MMIIGGRSSQVPNACLGKKTGARGCGRTPDLCHTRSRRSARATAGLDPPTTAHPSPRCVGAPEQSTSSFPRTASLLGPPARAATLHTQVHPTDQQTPPSSRSIDNVLPPPRRLCQPTTLYATLSITSIRRVRPGLDAATCPPAGGTTYSAVSGEGPRTRPPHPTGTGQGHTQVGSRGRHHLCPARLPCPGCDRCGDADDVDDCPAAMPMTHPRWCLPAMGLGGAARVPRRTGAPPPFYTRRRGGGPLCRLPLTDSGVRRV